MEIHIKTIMWYHYVQQIGATSALKTNNVCGRHCWSPNHNQLLVYFWKQSILFSSPPFLAYPYAAEYADPNSNSRFESWWINLFPVIGLSINFWHNSGQWDKRRNLLIKFCRRFAHYLESRSIYSIIWWLFFKSETFLLLSWGFRNVIRTTVLWKIFFLILS